MATLQERIEAVRLHEDQRARVVASLIGSPRDVYPVRRAPEGRA